MYVSTLSKYLKNYIIESTQNLNFNVDILTIVLSFENRDHLIEIYEIIKSQEIADS